MVQRIRAVRLRETISGKGLGVFFFFLWVFGGFCFFCWGVLVFFGVFWWFLGLRCPQEKNRRGGVWMGFEGLLKPVFFCWNFG